ncbi:hypothetical protein DFH06DRAFT_1144260 [Mycena polygramma]|nr:hypothetical protein DFH06DRAFT_1144260 [Mycena polygramma]
MVRSECSDQIGCRVLSWTDAIGRTINEMRPWRPPWDSLEPGHNRVVTSTPNWEPGHRWLVTSIGDLAASSTDRIFAISQVSGPLSAPNRRLSRRMTWRKSPTRFLRVKRTSIRLERPNADSRGNNPVVVLVPCRCPQSGMCRYTRPSLDSTPSLARRKPRATCRKGPIYFLRVKRAGKRRESRNADYALDNSMVVLAARCCSLRVQNHTSFIISVVTTCTHSPPRRWPLCAAVATGMPPQTAKSATSQCDRVDKHELNKPSFAATATRSRIPQMPKMIDDEVEGEETVTQQAKGLVPKGGDITQMGTQVTTNPRENWLPPEPGTVPRWKFIENGDSRSPVDVWCMARRRYPGRSMTRTRYKHLKQLIADTGDL